MLCCCVLLTGTDATALGRLSFRSHTYETRRVLHHMTDSHSQAPGALLRRSVLLWLNSKFNNHHHHHDQDRWVLGRPLQLAICAVWWFANFDLIYISVFSFSVHFSSSLHCSVLGATTNFNFKKARRTLDNCRLFGWFLYMFTSRSI